MALISRIRKHSWIIVASLAIALLGFLIMDVVQNNTFGGNTKFNIGKVNGTNIDYNDFSRTEQILYNNSTADPYARRNYLWNYFVEKALLEKTSDKLGIGVSSAEMDELQFGNNLSPIIQQRFINPNTGVVDREQLNQIKQGLENNQLQASLVTYWNEQKNEIIKERLQAKYTSLISKAIYVPAWQSELRNAESNELIDFHYVKLPFDLIKDSITISNSDIEKYIASHPNQYKYPEEARFVEYVNFMIEPTKEDSVSIYEGLAALVDSFRNTKDDSLFVSLNEGTKDDAYVAKSALSPAMADQLYGLAKGAVVGPYIDGTNYVVAKMVDRKVIPDSVKVRHILRSVQTADQLPSAQATIDSLKSLIETGKAKFDSLAIKFSQDPGSGFNGGDLGMSYPGQMVKPFNDVIFYKAEVNKLYAVTSQFGVHLIEVTQKKFNKTGGADQVQIAYLNRPIIPSQETQNKVEDEVNAINNANRKAADLKKALASRKDIKYELTGAIRQNDAVAGQLPSSESTRSLVRWAFDKSTNIGDVSNEIYNYEDAVNFYTKQLTIAALKSIQPKGLANADAVRDDISQLLINKIKGEKLLKELGTATDMYAVASKYNVKIDTAANVNFSTSFLPAMGNEPKVIAAAFGLEKNATSKPILGGSGVFIAKTVNRTPSVGASDASFFSEQVASVTKNNVQSFLMESLKKNAKIKDNRFTFF